MVVTFHGVEGELPLGVEYKIPLIGQLSTYQLRLIVAIALALLFATLWFVALNVGVRERVLLYLVIEAALKNLL
jgi:hypothetical protein